MSNSKNWITAQQLLDRWNILDFELLKYLKGGLRSYNRFGKRVIDVDSEELERAKVHPYEYYEAFERRRNMPPRVEGVRGRHWQSFRFIRKTDQQIKEAARKAFEGQPLVIINQPPDSVIMNFTVPVTETKAEELHRKLLELLFHINDILEFEKTQGIVPVCSQEEEERIPPAEPGIRVDRSGDMPSRDLPFPCPDAQWEEISFVLKSNDLVEVKTPKGEARIRYDLLGFADRRSGDRPNKTTWPLFMVFAKLNGTISRRNTDYIRQLPDKARLLNKHLKETFGINQSIYTGHYKKQGQYKTRFRIRDDRLG